MADGNVSDVLSGLPSGGRDAVSCPLVWIGMVVCFDAMAWVLHGIVCFPLVACMQYGHPLESTHVSFSQSLVQS